MSDNNFEDYIGNLDVNIDFDKLNQWDMLIIEHVEDNSCSDGIANHKISVGLLSGWTTAKVELCLITNEDLSDENDEFIESCLIKKITRINLDTQTFEEI